MKYPTYITSILLLALISLTGCKMLEQPLPIMVAPQQSPAQPTTQRQRFAETTAMESEFDNANALAQQNQKMSKQLQDLTSKNADLIDDNDRMAKRVELLKEDLNMTEKELKEANDLLIEMRMELDNWKKNVLGFRNEVNTAHTEQLRALVKILKLMGAEFVPQTEEK